MRIYFNILLLTIALLVSCKADKMKIDPLLLGHSTSYAIEAEAGGNHEILKFGPFSTYASDFGLAWMDETGITEFFNEGELYKFSTDNNDNYRYDNIVSRISDTVAIKNFAGKFNVPLETIPAFSKAFVGYLFAPHDEYAFIYFKNGDKTIGYLSNGYELYEIAPVIEQKTDSKELYGYQFVLNKEIVGALQIKSTKYFWMTNEYCDATEMVLATLASTVIKCNKI